MKKKMMTVLRNERTKELLKEIAIIVGSSIAIEIISSYIAKKIFKKIAAEVKEFDDVDMDLTTVERGLREEKEI